MYYDNSQLTHTGFSTGLYVLHIAATKVHKSARQYKADQKTRQPVTRYPVSPLPMKHVT
jgi:hypothetical protein